MTLLVFRFFQKDETLGFAEVEVNTLKQGANDLTLKLQEVKSGEISITITADFTGSKPRFYFLSLDEKRLTNSNKNRMWLEGSTNTL